MSKRLFPMLDCSCSNYALRADRCSRTRAVCAGRVRALTAAGYMDDLADLSGASAAAGWVNHAKEARRDRLLITDDKGFTSLLRVPQIFAELRRRGIWPKENEKTVDT